MIRAGILALVLASPAAAQQGAAVVILGEVHDNPAHHAEQARLVAALAPTAMVWEMLPATAPAAARGVDRRDGAALAAALGWEGLGWPDFALYAPVLAAAPGAELYGAALAPDELARARAEGAAAVFGAGAESYGLTPLAAADLAARVAGMVAAHCGALPEAAAARLVEAQRLKDAHMARLALAALDRHGPPVVVIAGTGHARRDTGIPAALAAARPGLRVWSLGQFEADPGPGAPFDAVNVTEPAPRPDPCAGLGGGG